MRSQVSQDARNIQESSVRWSMRPGQRRQLNSFLARFSQQLLDPFPMSSLEKPWSSIISQITSREGSLATLEGLRFTLKPQITSHSGKDSRKGLLQDVQSSPSYSSWAWSLSSAAEKETSDPKKYLEIRQPAIKGKGFMDDLTITTTSHVQA